MSTEEEEEEKIDFKILLIDDDDRWQNINRFIKEYHHYIKTANGKYFEYCIIKFRDTNNKNIIYNAKVYLIKGTDYATDIRMIDAKKECLEDIQILIYVYWKPHEKILERIKENRQFFFEERKDYVVGIYQNKEDFEVEIPEEIKAYNKFDDDVEFGACLLKHEIYTILHFSIENYLKKKCGEENEIELKHIKPYEEEEEEGNLEDSSNYYRCRLF